MNPTVFYILLIEDNPGDIRLIKEALIESGMNHHLSVVTDGIAAMNQLRSSMEGTEWPRPDLILLDFNLPKKDGREVLAEIKTDKDLRTIPVVILSSSEAEEDIISAYECYASCYIHKPLDLEAFFDVAESIRHFWIDTVKLPSRGMP